MNENDMSFLIGDNPFHGISHLSQERTRTRSDCIGQENAQHAARLVKLAFENGVDGFMFSVMKPPSSILKILRETNGLENKNLYAIVPYAYEYVRRATQVGGISGLCKSLAKEMIFSSNIGVVLSNVPGFIRFDLSSFLNTYVAYELARIKTAIKSQACLKSILLHEIITDMALALNMEKLFKSYIKRVEKSGVRPGFETRNFPYLVEKFSEWKVDFSRVTLTASFNKIGFQMVPSKSECEQALERVRGAEVVAMSVLAGGYFKPAEAMSYIANLHEISGVVIGVSNERHSIETFNLLKQAFNSGNYK